MSILFNSRKLRKLQSVLGLTLTGSRLDGVALRRVNGALQIQRSFSATLTLDPLTDAPELVGREIRHQLDAAGVRERHCVFGAPLRWVLTAHTELPPLPEADAASLLQLEAERGFSTDITTLQLDNSRSSMAGDRKYVLFTGIPSAHVASLECVLLAAKLKPVCFAIGLCALQPPDAEQSKGVLALSIAENSVSLQITCGGGVAALRALEGPAENEAGPPKIQPDYVARESRITLGQLPAELRDTVKRIRIFGPRELAQPLADEMELRFEPMGLNVEIVSAYAPNEFGAQVPSDAPISPAFSLAARALAMQPPVFDYLPPKPTLVEQFKTKYSSGRLRTTGAIAAAILVLLGGLFFIQQIQLWRLSAQWKMMSSKVGDLKAVSGLLAQFRPWFDETYSDLAILRAVTLAFPEEGSVTAKTIQIQNDNAATCSGIARDNAALLKMLADLRGTDGVNGLKVDLIHGKSPMQFTIDFQYVGGAQ